jgi:hypothetical protein
MKPITALTGKQIETLHRWKEQIIEEETASAKSRATNKAVLDAYAFGVRQGMAQLIMVLQIQGWLQPGD